MYPDETVVQNCRLAALAHVQGLFSLQVVRGTSRLGAVDDIAREALALVDLTSLADARAGDLSHGDKKRLDIAVALATKPQLLLLDEPVAGMSIEEVQKTDALIRGLAKRMTVLLIEHDMNMIMGISDSITVLHQGKVLAEGTPAEIRAECASAGSVSRRPYGGARLSAARCRARCCASNSIDTYYGDSHILKRLSFHIARGETVALLGRNGVGKTTALKSIVGWVPPRVGRIVFDGADVTGCGMMESARRGISLVPEERRIFTNLTVYENLKLAQVTARKPGWSLDDVYARFPRLKERAKNKGDEISGGEKQMLAIARALVQDTKLLLLDEPTEGLAPLDRARGRSDRTRDQGAGHDDSARRAKLLLRARGRRPVLRDRSRRDAVRRHAGRLCAATPRS